MSKLLIVVDMQNDFVTGTLGFPEAAEIIEPIKCKIQEQLRHNFDVLFTRDIHNPINYLNTREGKHLPIKHCVDVQGSAIVSEFNEFFDENFEYIQELTKSQFGLEPDNQYVLESYPEIEICGLVTDICVLSVAITLQNMFPNIEITVDASCCRAVTKEKHKKALDILEGLGINIINR